MSKNRSQPASENELIRLLKQRYSTKNPLLKIGIGDDAAVIRPKRASEFWLITSDMLVENVDFERRWTTAEQLGRKSIAVNLSDLAAMGARPRFFTVSLAVPTDIPERWIIEFHDGLAERGNAFGAHLIGGDMSRSEEHIVVSITLMGESLNRKVLYRSGGKEGDLLYVTGDLGRSAAGLKILQTRRVPAQRGLRKEALQAQLDPEPRCASGLWLAQSGLVSCMIDLSDGISMDLPRLCTASGVGAEIRMASLPVFAGSAEWNCDPIELALYGGEDYELLFAVPKSKCSLLEKNYPAALPRITRIGELTPGPGRVWVVAEAKRKTRRRLPERGFDHFAVRK